MLIMTCLTGHQPGLQASGKASMNSQQLQSLVGPGPANPSRPVNIGDAGVAFVLAAAGSIPGGAPTVRACFMPCLTIAYAFKALTC